MGYKLNGINSDTEICEQCGKTGLKRVMWLESLDTDGNGTGNMVAMGTTCGAKALGFQGTFSNIYQVETAVTNRELLTQAINRAKELAAQFNDEIAIIRNGNGYTTVRGKAFEANPNRYGMPVRWVGGN